MKFGHWVLLFMVLSSMCLANTDHQLLDCRKLANNELRLACYDHIANTILSRNAKLKSPSQPTQTNDTLRSSTPAPNPQAVNPVVVSNHKEQKSVTEANTEDFGAEHITRKENKERTIISRLMNESFEGWAGKTKFYLENGQVWKQTDKRKFYLTLKNPTARIEKGLFGVYYLNIDGYNSRVRVKRIK